MKLRRGAMKEVAETFGVTRLTVSRIWHRAIASLEGGKLAMDVSSNKNKCGRKPKNFAPQLQALSDVPLNERGTVRGVAHAIGVSKSTVHRKIQKGDLRSHTNAVKPYLTQRNKEARVTFCMEHVDRQRGIFLDMMDSGSS